MVPLSSEYSSPLTSSCRNSPGRRNVVFFIFLILGLVISSSGTTVDILSDSLRNHNELEESSLHLEYMIEEDPRRKRNLRSSKHKHKHKHSHAAKKSLSSSSLGVTKVGDNSEAKAAYAAEKLRKSQLESSRTDKKPLNQLYTEEVVLLFEALHVYNCAPIIRYNHLEGANLMEIDNALELQKVGIQIPTSDANVIYQKISELRVAGVPVLFVEQKPPKLFAEIELKERGEKADEGGSFRCPAFDPPKVDYSDISSAGSSSSGDDRSNVPVSGKPPNTEPQAEPQYASTPMYPSPFTPVLPPSIAPGATGNSEGVANTSNKADDPNSNDKKNKNDNDNKDDKDKDNKFTGNFKKTSEGKIVVKDASGNEIHF